MKDKLTLVQELVFLGMILERLRPTAFHFQPCLVVYYYI